MPMKYDAQTRAQAICLVTEHGEGCASEHEAIKAVASRLGMKPETPRTWLRQAEVDAGDREGATTSAAREIRELKCRNTELEQTIEILKAATSFFVRESDPRQR